eukprot:1722511-Amphidinium_carterae.1
MERMSRMVETLATRALTPPAAVEVRQTSFRSLLDPKVLSSLPVFSGADEDFLEWETRFKSVCGLLNME